MKYRFTIVLLLAIADLCSPGCMVSSFPTNEVKGTVIDTSTRKPIQGVRVALHENHNISSQTSADGSFDLPPAKVWKVFLIGEDYVNLFVGVDFDASGYQPVVKGFEQKDRGNLIVVDTPIELHKQSSR